MSCIDALCRRFVIYYALIVLYGRGIDIAGIWPAFLLAVLLHRQPLDQPSFCNGLALCMSLVYIMDWGMWYQNWPLPTVAGAVIGKILDMVLLP